MKNVIGVLFLPLFSLLCRHMHARGTIIIVRLVMISSRPPAITDAITQGSALVSFPPTSVLISAGDDDGVWEARLGAKVLLADCNGTVVDDNLTSVPANEAVRVANGETSVEVVVAASC